MPSRSCKSETENLKHRGSPSFQSFRPQHTKPSQTRLMRARMRRAQRRRARRKAGGKSSDAPSNSKSFHAVPTGRPPAQQGGAATITHAAPRNAPRSRRHSPCADLTAAAIRSAQERILSSAFPLLQSGKENPEPRNSHIIRSTAASAASPRREAGGKSRKETPDSKSFRAAPLARPPPCRAGGAATITHAAPTQRAPCSRNTSHPRRRERFAPSPVLSQGGAPFQKLPPTAAPQGAPAGRRPALAEREGGF